MMQPNTKSKIIDIYLASITSRKITRKSHLSVLKLCQSADRSEKKLIKYLRMQCVHQTFLIAIKLEIMKEKVLNTKRNVINSKFSEIL